MSELGSGHSSVISGRQADDGGKVKARSFRSETCKESPDSDTVYKQKALRGAEDGENDLSKLQTMQYPAVGD